MRSKNIESSANISANENALSKLERKFSKELAQELRNETAKKLREARRMPKNFEALRKIKKTERADYEPSVQEAIEQTEKNIFGRIFQTYKFKQNLYNLDSKLQRAKSWHIEKVEYDYQDKLDRILSETPLTEAEMKTYLSEEAMSSMSLEDYLILLKRLSGNFVTHVTRQGVREQGWFHDAGMGDFFDSFTKILKNKKLESFLANFATDPNSIPYLVSAIRNVKKQTGLTGEALAAKALDLVEKSHDNNMPADQGSVHVATNTVASYYYGSEQGYDFYFYFPAEFVAYNYLHHHKGKQNSTIERLQGLSGRYDTDWTDKHNDLAIWNEGKGIPIDAGITCIPKDVKVDRLSGSQYKLVDGKPIKKADGSGYELAEDTITSQEFWENYFKTNPEQRPKKLIYGRFETTPKFEPTQHYQPLFESKVFRTSKDIPNYYEIDTETFEQFKIKLVEFIAMLEEQQII